MSDRAKDYKFITESFNKLQEEFGLLEFENDFEDEARDEDSDVYIPFPREEGDIEIDKLVDYLKEIDTFKIHDFNKVTTDTVTQRVLIPSEVSPIVYLGLLPYCKKNGIQLHITSEPFLIGLAASKLDEYSKYTPPCSSHIAIEVIYESKESRLSNQDEENLIKTYLFELSHLFKISFEYGSFENIDAFDEARESIINDSYNIPESTEDYNPGMDLFINANHSISQDLKYLSYYKIFEYFAPIHSKIDAFEAMKKKLDSSHLSSLNADYISSIFDLAREYEQSLRDKELIKSLIDKTFDLVDIYNDLPDSIKKELRLKELKYSTKSEAKDSLANKLGNILYTTRNSIVHAKSNFSSNGLECKVEDLEQLNNFMHKACYSTIKWYNRLPKHLKITEANK